MPYPRLDNIIHTFEQFLDRNLLFYALDSAVNAFLTQSAPRHKDIFLSNNTPPSFVNIPLSRCGNPLARLE